MINLAAILAVLLFRFGYWICDLCFENGSEPWWDLRFTIFTVIFVICFGIVYFAEKSSTITKKIILIGIAYLFGDIIDRYLFKINYYNMNDIVLDLFAVIILFKIYEQYNYAKTNRCE